MDRQEYLNQISAKNRPAKSQNKIMQVLTSKYFIIGAGAAILIILMMLVGSLIGSSKGSLEQKLISLKLHVNNTSSVVSNYQRFIKSSTLRSGNASLSSVLANTERDLTAYISDKYPEISKDTEQELTDAANLAKDGLEADLLEAKISGVLDRTYAHKMAYEISMLMTEEESIVNAAQDDALKEIMATSYNSLETVYTTFGDFSETK